MRGPLLFNDTTYTDTPAFVRGRGCTTCKNTGYKGRLACIEAINNYPVRTQLSFVLEGVCVQQLIPKADGAGRAMCMELMLLNPAIRALIRSEKLEQIPSMIEIGAGEGMCTMNQSLYRLYKRNIVTLDMAMKRSSNQEGLQNLIDKGLAVK